MYWLFGLVLASLASSAALRERQDPPFPDPRPCSGDCGGQGYGDCSIVIRNGVYYRYSKAVNPGDGLQLRTATSLRGNWTLKKTTLFPKHIVDPYGQPHATAHLWAPEVHYIDGLYYIFYGVVNHGFDIAVATSPDLSVGSWTQHGSINIPASPTGAYTRLGATLLRSANDTSGEAPAHFFAFGSDRTGLYGIHMANPPLTVQAGAKPIELIADQPVPVDPKFNNNSQRTEGPFLYQRHYNGATKFYVFYSRGLTAAAPGDPASVQYRIEVCRADAVTGPYMDAAGRNCLDVVQKYGDDQPGTLVLKSHSQGQVSSPGSLGIMDDPEEGLVMYYQYRNLSAPTLEHTFGYNYLGFNQTGWPKLLPTRSSVVE